MEGIIRLQSSQILSEWIAKLLGGSAKYNSPGHADENATCKYDSLDRDYNSMAYNFGTTGGTSHSQVVSLSCDESYNYYVRCRDSGQSQNTSSASISFSIGGAAGQNIFLNEHFNDGRLSSRGWFDAANIATDTIGCYSGSGCAKFSWANGQTRPTGVTVYRYAIPATDKLYVSFYWKFDSTWIGSRQPYHPHLLYILSDLDYNADPYSSLAQNYLQTYIEVGNSTTGLP